MGHTNKYKVNPLKIWLTTLTSLPSALWESVSGKREDLISSIYLHTGKQKLDWDETAAEHIRLTLEDMVKRNGTTCLSRFESKEELSLVDKMLVKEIKDAVQQGNRSNITRTQSYLDVYGAYPELHWALLAHFVSRNGGWNMTDLKGGQESRLFGDQATYHHYRFLERSNALIFQDAFPQLLLYAYSKKQGKSLFHLLPYFHVSRFMRPFWEQFWLNRSSSLLTVGLIINEQNYIDKRVVQHPFFQRNVTHKTPYELSIWGSLNQVVFPYSLPEESTSRQARVVGRVIQNFENVKSRIHIGKHLYMILFGLPRISKGAEQFAVRVPHTGSRADYWPGIFSTDEKEAHTSPVQGAELLHDRFNPVQRRIYSPQLQSSYSDTPYEPPISREEWFKSEDVIGEINVPRLPILCEQSHSHQLNILKRAYAHDTIARVRRLRAYEPE